MGNIEEIYFREGDFELSLRVEPQADTVWLNRQQMAQLFGRDIKTIGTHIQSALREEQGDSVVASFATTANDGKTNQGRILQSGQDYQRRPPGQIHLRGIIFTTSP